MKNRKKADLEKRKDRYFDGLGVSPGIAFGTVFIREGGAVDVPQYKISKAKLDSEQKRLNTAVDLAKQQIRKLGIRAKKHSGTAGKEISVLFDAYHAMLGDSRLVRGAQQRIVQARTNAEAAVQAELMAILSCFQVMDDQYIAARMDDIREVRHRNIRNQTESPGQ